MAAPIQACLSKIRRYSIVLNLSRSYARKTKRSVQAVMQPEADVYKNRHSIADPRKNAYLPFDPNDPVQKSLSNATLQRKESKVNRSEKKVNKNENKHILTKAVRNETTIGEINTPPKTLKDQQSQYEHGKLHTGKGKDKKVMIYTRKGKDKNIMIDYEKLAEGDNRFGRVIMEARSKKDRDEHREIVLEGKNLIEDALTAGAKLKVLYFTNQELLEGFPVEFLVNTQIYQVQMRHLKLWSDVETPQGLLGIFEMPPANKALKPAVNPIPLTLICDSVRDGGNLGTLIRIAAAVGCHSVIALKGCVDVWNGKVLRSAAGSHFRVPIISNVTWPNIPALLPPEDSVKVFLANSNQVTEEYMQSLSGTLEAAAQIEQLKNMDNKILDLEIDDENVNISELTESQAEDFDEEYEILSKQEQKKLDTKDDEDGSYKNFDLLNAYRKAPLAVEFYDNVNYTDKHAVLLINGETSRVSLPARKLAYDHYGACVTIPMEAEVESLNCAVAGSIIMYEIFKQYRHLRVAVEQNKLQNES